MLPVAALQSPVGEEIVVTGSRIARSGYEAPTPITVISADDIQRDSPTNLSDFINKFPAFGNSFSSRNSGTSVGDGNAGVSNLNLRSLGANRTLVLLDGARIVPSSIAGFYGNGGAVDTNAFPDALISRVEIVTGGASAAYGSDALSGLVNFVLDKSFTGVKGTVQGGLTTYGDDAQYLISLTGGRRFAGDRGHLLVSLATTHNDGVLHPSNRQWLQHGRGLLTNPIYTPSGGAPFLIVRENVGSSRYAPGGLITSGPLKGITFGPGGAPRAFNYGDINDGALMSGGDWKDTVGALSNSSITVNSSLDAKLTRRNVFARVSRDLGDGAQLFGQFMYAGTDSLSFCCGTTESNITIQSGNPFIPPAIQNQMNALGLPSYSLSIYNKELGVAGSKNTRRLHQFSLGVSGRIQAFDRPWSWEVEAERSGSHMSIYSINNPVARNFLQAVDVVRSPATGAPMCRSSLANPSDGCVPYNPMGLGLNSRAAMEYVTGTGHLNQRIVQTVAAANFRGEPFANWAGPLSLAAGFEYREEGVAGEATALDESNAFWVGNFHATDGSYHINEGFIETVVPLAKNEIWARALDFNAVFRATGYSTSGRVTTWKVGTTYRPVPDVRFRATRSRDIRAPNLGELFLSGQSGTGTLVDPFTANQLVPVITVRIGNPALKPEQADTTGIGAVYQPSWLPGFSASFDYYSIYIDGAISLVGAQAALNQCFGGNQMFCRLIQRNAGGNLSLIYTTPANTSFAQTNGFDIEASYVQKLPDLVESWPGVMTARLLATHVTAFNFALGDGSVVSGLGVQSGLLALNTPRWRYNLSFDYVSDTLSAGWTVRGFSSGVQDSRYIECAAACPVTAPPNYTIDNNHLPSAIYMDLSLTYRLPAYDTPGSDIFLMVDNIANRQPSFAFLGFSPGQYDTLGRVFRIGARFRL